MLGKIHGKFFADQKQPELAKHNSTKLDLVFILDTTGSMGSYIESATKLASKTTYSMYIIYSESPCYGDPEYIWFRSQRQIVEDIVASENSDINLGLVEFRDHPPEDTSFVTRTNGLTSSVKEMKMWLENSNAQGGGDRPEAIADALQDALELNWREDSTKICVLICDAPPHGLVKEGDTFPDGCPKGIDPIEIVKKMIKKEIVLYSIGCEPAIKPYKDFFSAIAFMTGGQYVPLTNAELLSRVIIGGAQEEISLSRLTREVEEEINSQKMKGVENERDLAKAIETSLRSKGLKAKSLKYNNESIEKPSERAIGYSKKDSLKEISDEFSGKKLSSVRSHKELGSKASRIIDEEPEEETVLAPKKEEHEEHHLDTLDKNPANKLADEIEKGKSAYTTDVGDVSIEQSFRLLNKILQKKK